MDYELLGRNVKKYRKECGLTQESLAEALGLSSVFLSQIENAKGKPSLETFVAISNELDVSLDVLAGTRTANKKIADYVNIPLNEAQLDIIGKMFSGRSDAEIIAIFKAFDCLLKT